MKTIFRFTALSLILSALPSSPVHAQKDSPSVAPDREIIVMFTSGAILDSAHVKAGRVEDFQFPSREFRQILQDANLEAVSRLMPDFRPEDRLVVNRTGEQVKLADWSNVYLLRCPAGQRGAILDQLRNRSEIVYAEPNGRVTRDEIIPNDPFFPGQWALKNNTYPSISIQATQAWDITTGSSSIKIGIVDTGINGNNPELVGRVTGDPYDLTSNHGMSVAGIAAASGNNSLYMAGIAWNVGIINEDIFPPAPGDTTTDNATAAAGVLSALNRGADVINNSWGGPVFSITVRSAFADVFKQNKVAVAAMGNDADKPGGGLGFRIYPAGIEQGVIAVGAITKFGVRADFSNTGSWIDVAAPGQNVLSIDADDTTDFGGTSAATPHVSGVAALLLSVDPTLYNDDVTELIRLGALDIGDTLGFDAETGTGLVNARQSLDFITQPPYVLSHKTDTGGYVQSVSNTFPMTFFSTPNLASGQYNVKKYVVRKTVTFPAAFSSPPDVWGRGVATTGFSQENPNFGMGWCQVVPGTVTTTTATLETIVYDIWNLQGQHVGFRPAAPSNAVFAYTILGQLPPAAPSSLAATPLSSTQIRLNWLDLATNESGFKIERKKSTESTYTQIATVGANVNTYTNSGLQTGITYNYRIRAYNQVGDSPYSNVATATTQSVPPITSVTITGPDPATPNVKNFYTVDITGGSGNFDIQWYKRDSASGSNYFWYDGYTTTTDVTPGPTTFALRVDVTDNASSQFVQAWKGVGGASTPTKPVVNLPSIYALEGNYPNPFNPSTTIRFALPQASHVRLEIYNVAGQRVRLLLDESRPAGRHAVVWDGRSDSGSAVASGLYLYRITAGAFVARKKMTLLK